jgi:hypothetical protein
MTMSAVDQKMNAAESKHQLLNEKIKQLQMVQHDLSNLENQMVQMQDTVQTVLNEGKIKSLNFFTCFFLIFF